MANWKELYKGGGYMTLKQLKAAVVDTITSVEVRERTIKTKTATKVEITVDKLPSPVILNQESAAALGKAYGDDTDDWLGKKVKIAKGSVQGPNGQCNAIVVTPVGKG